MAAEFEVPACFKCPLSGDLMCDPVTLADGLNYERGAAEDWLSKYDVSKITELKFSHKVLPLIIHLLQEYTNKMSSYGVLGLSLCHRSYAKDVVPRLLVRSSSMYMSLFEYNVKTFV